MAPIVNGVISARHNNLFIGAQNKNFNLQAQILKLKTNSTNIITTATYINNGQMLARQIDNNNLQNYVNDAKGSVLKLNNFDGSNNQNYSYDAYGNIINAVATHSFQKTSAAINPIIAQGINVQRGIVAAAIINPFQYNGERTDANTALQYLRARFYNPETKRFVNQDTYNLLNKFGYVDGNPVMKADSSGHNAVSDWFKDHWQACVSIAGIVLGVALPTVMAVCFVVKYKKNNELLRREKKYSKLLNQLILAMKRGNEYYGNTFSKEGQIAQAEAEAELRQTLYSADQHNCEFEYYDGSSNDHCHDPENKMLRYMNGCLEALIGAENGLKVADLVNQNARLKHELKETKAARAVLEQENETYKSLSPLRKLNLGCV